MKKTFGILFLQFLFFASVHAQVQLEIFPMDPQTGGNNYFGVRVSVSEAYNYDITATGYIYEESNPSTNNPFSLTISAGNLSAETAANFYQAGPASSANGQLATIIYMYAGVQVIFDAAGNILKFNSTADVNTVLNQLEADYETHNQNYENQYPNLTAEQLDDMDEQTGFDQFKPMRDFENLFAGFTSQRAIAEGIEAAWLANNFTSADPDATDLTFDDALNTIFNQSYSFSVGNTLYQLTANGMYIGGVLNQDVGTIALNVKMPTDTYLEESYYLPIVRNTGGPSLDVTNFNLGTNFIAPTNCKSNKNRDTLAIFDNDTKRAKYKVSITSIAIRSGVGGKVVFYKKRSNGSWKNSRTEMAVTCGGTIYNGDCSTNFQFSDREPSSGHKKRNRLSTRRHTSANPPSNATIWKTYSNYIGMAFEFPNLATGSLALTF